MNKHFVLIFLPHEGFEGKEYRIITDTLIHAGIDYLVTSSHFSPAHASDYETEVVPDITIERLDPKNYSGYIFLSGRSPREFAHNDIVRGILEFSFTNSRLIAAIGNAVEVVVSSKQIKGKKLTTVPKDKGMIEATGAIYTGNIVEKDDNLLTAKDSSAAQSLADLIVEILNEGNDLKGRKYLR